MDLPGLLQRARRLLGFEQRRPFAAAEPEIRLPSTRALDVLRRTEEFNRNAETYWRDVKTDPAGRRHVLNRPLGNVGEAAQVLYRLGIVLAELRPGLGHTVLDFASGSGWLSAWLNRLGCRTIALDVSPTALELGRELFALDARQRPELRPEFLAYDGRRIPLPDASVDRIVSFDGFHHVPNPDEVLLELARVLKPGGRAVFAEPGEGHSDTDASRVETEKAGVLENELDVQGFTRAAERAGFTDVKLKPYPDPGAIRVSPADYLSLQGGDDARFPMQELRDGLKRFYLFVLAKGAGRHDSRAPNLLRAEIRADVGTLRGAGRSSVSVPVRVRNVGDTLWLSEPDGLGGYVMLAGHLHSARGDRVVRGAFRVPLPYPVAPGQSVELQVAVPLPAEIGRYQVELDLVDENVAWFGQSGSPTTRLAVEVDRLAEQDEPDALRARLETASARVSALPGTLVELLVRATNEGRQAWPGPSEERTVRLAGHLLGPTGDVLAPDYVRTGLQARVEPGGSVELAARFRAPLDAGAYRLKLDLVLEQVCWFEQRGSRPLEIALEVPQATPDSRAPGQLRAVLERLDPGGPLAAPAGATVALAVRATNAGNTLWLHHARAQGGHVALGGHLRDADAALLTLDFLRVPLPEDVPPGGRVELPFELRMPERPGRYRLELDMVDEGLEWFAASGSPTLELELIALAGGPERSA